MEKHKFVMKDKNFLITGGLGHLGGALGFQLSEDNEVIVPAINQVNNVPFIIHNCDVTNYEKLREIVIREKIDYIVHLAGHKSSSLKEKDIRRIFQNNYICTLNVLELVKEKLVRGVILGTGHNELVNYYSDTYKVPIIQVEMCDIYGPGDINPNHEIPTIYRKKERGIKTSIKEFESHPKQWIFISDAVNAFKELLMNFDKAVGKKYQVMDNKFFSGRDIYNYVNKGKIDNKKMFSKTNYGFFNWKPKIGIDEGLKQCDFWYGQVFSKS